MPHIRVELPGLVLENGFTRTVPFLQDLRNWHDSPETMRDSEPRERGFGLFRDDDPPENGRFPVVYGALRSMAPGSEWVLREKVMALKSIGPFELRVTDPSGTWRSEVVVTGKIVFSVTDDGWADFEIPLEADDPRLYGPRLSGSTGVPVSGAGFSDPIIDPLQEAGGGNLARVSFTNSGTAPTEPTVTVRGGVSEGFELLHVEAGRVIRCIRPIPDGSFVRVDNTSGEVWIDDQSPLPSTYLPVAEWFQVGAGESCTIQWAPLGAVSGTPEMLVEFAEASW